MASDGPPWVSTMTWSTWVSAFSVAMTPTNAQGGSQQRQGNADEALDRAGAVDPGGVEQVLGDAGETREKEQHVVAAVLPDSNGDDGTQGERRVAQPVGLGEAKTGEVVIEQARIGEEDEGE